MECHYLTRRYNCKFHRGGESAAFSLLISKPSFLKMIRDRSLYFWLSQASIPNHWMTLTNMTDNHSLSHFTTFCNRKLTMVTFQTPNLLTFHWFTHPTLVVSRVCRDWSATISQSNWYRRYLHVCYDTELSRSIHRSTEDCMPKY